MIMAIHIKEGRYLKLVICFVVVSVFGPHQYIKLLGNEGCLQNK